MSTSDPPPPTTTTTTNPSDPEPTPTTTATTADSTRPPSPPPPPAPIIPGPRASAFREVLHRALTQSLKACPYPHFASCFPTLSTHNPAMLSAIHKQYLAQLEGLATASFERILEMRRVVENLNALEDLVAEARERKKKAEAEGKTPGLVKGVAVGAPAPAEVVVSPSMLPASAIIAAHLRPLLVAAQTPLKAKLDTLTSENESLMKAIEDQKKEIRALVGQVEKVVGDMQGAVEVVGECFPPGRKVGLVEGDRMDEDHEDYDEEEGEGQGEGGQVGSVVGGGTERGAEERDVVMGGGRIPGREEGGAGGGGEKMEGVE